MSNHQQQAFTPFQLGPITLRNRFIRAGANEAMSLNGTPTRAMVKHHRDMARGGGCADHSCLRRRVRTWANAAESDLAARGDHP